MTSLIEKVARAQAAVPKYYLTKSAPAGMWMVLAENGVAVFSGSQTACECWIAEQPARAAIAEVFAHLEEPSETVLDAGANTEEMQAVDELIIFASVHGHGLEIKTPPILAAYKAMHAVAKAEALNE